MESCQQLDMINKILKIYRIIKQLLLDDLAIVPTGDCANLYIHTFH